MQKPSLRVIKGSWIAGSEWLNFPTTVAAPSPFDRLQACSFRIAKEDVVKAALARRREPAFSLWSIVLGMRNYPRPFAARFSRRGHIN